jgi:hypothetical protein
VGVVSQDATEYVKALVSSPAGRKITPTQRGVLKVLAFRHRLEVNCAWAGVPDIATESLFSERTVQRALTALEDKGIITRHKAVRPNGSLATSEYEFPGMKGAAVTLEMRQQVFSKPRERMAVQMDLPAFGESTTTVFNGSSLAVALQQVTDGSSLAVALVEGTNRGESSAVALDQRTNGSSLAVAVQQGTGGSGKACGNEVELSPPLVTTGVTTPGDNMVSPLEYIYEDSLKIELPLPPLGCAACGESKSKSANQEQEQRTTASASAKATTPVMRAALVSMERGGEAGMSSGDVPLDRSSVFWQMGMVEDFAAAVVEETALVLMGCGIAKGNSTQRQRTAVRNALIGYLEQQSVSVDAAGNFAVQQWRMYLDRAEGMVHKVDVRRFFAEGLWLQDWTSPAYRSRGEATIGMDARQRWN